MNIRDLYGFKQDIAASRFRARLRIPEGVAKSCVFCDNEDLVLEGTESNQLGGKELLEDTASELAFKVRCTDCNAAGPSVKGFCASDGMLQAIAAWNRRENV